jgi:DmsE family decaheme c-type cytochrome
LREHLRDRENTSDSEAGTRTEELHAAHDEESMMKTMTRRAGIAALLAIAVAVEFALPFTAAAEPEAYAEEEMDDCLGCHDESAKSPVLPILATQHAVKADGRAPLAQRYECQTCHGPSAAHLEDESTPAAIRFGPDLPAGPQNEVCLGCHQGGDRINWQGSVHATSDVACASCHSIHVLEDQVTVENRRPDTPAMRGGQIAVCFRCHADKRAEIHKTSSHPLRDGAMVCSDCHNSHGSMGPVNLQKPTLNETCYTCHAEKRGPFLWEHAPAAEDCGSCHTPHGSNHPMLLTARVPQLCQSCHVPGGHPSAAYGGPDYSNSVPGAPVIDRYVGAKGCLNCHIEVHGSNHPSGVRFTR